MEEQHPIPTIRVILQNLEGKILILQRASHTVGGGGWCLPGGKLDYNKKGKQACTDEIKEETNLDIDYLRFLFYQDGRPKEEGARHFITLYFTALYSGDVQINKESDEAEWVDPMDLDKYNVLFGDDVAIRKFLTGKF